MQSTNFQEIIAVSTTNPIFFRFSATPAIVAGIVVGLFVLGCVIAGLVLCIRARAEAKHANAAWISDWDEIQSDHKGPGAGSRISMNSATSSKTALQHSGSLYSGTEASVTHSDRGARNKLVRSTGRLVFATWRGQMVMVRICDRKYIELNKKLLAEVKVVRDIVHDNLLRFLGAIFDLDHTAVIGEYCSKGSLQVKRHKINLSKITLTTCLWSRDCIISTLCNVTRNDVSRSKQNHIKKTNHAIFFILLWLTAFCETNYGNKIFHADFCRLLVTRHLVM